LEYTGQSMEATFMTSLWLENKPIIDTDPFEAGAEFDEVIVGAGITGLATALMFARAGRKVAVVEARFVGAVTTGHTTAKLTVLQGLQLSRIKKAMYQSVVQAYADGNRAAFDWMIEYLGKLGVPVERKDAMTHAETVDGAALVRREFEVAKSVGLDVAMTKDTGLPFRTEAAVVLRDQAQFNPMDVLGALAADVRELGGRVYQGAPVTGVRASDPAVVSTALGDLRAGHVILATGHVILDRGLYFAKVKASRSYALAFDPNGNVPDGMFINAERPTHSIRTYEGKLIIGGNGHGVGRRSSPRSAVDELERWTTSHWRAAVRTHAWSAQDYVAPHHVPFVGALPRGRGRIFVATGYDKWGMTNSIAAAMTLVADILGENTAWQRTLHHRVTTPRALAAGIGENAAVGWWYLKGYGRSLSRRLPVATPAEGAAMVGRSGIQPVGVSTVDGATCRVSLVCPHLRAVVAWNDLEYSWDCPAHGSRFAADGSRLEGPAKGGLRRLD
jgi:glycine/D-amino acid oxidase-like deaminating enzyme/nitrite reductase/ring-hydroxylating ferredoxin subunit